MGGLTASVGTLSPMRSVWPIRLLTWAGAFVAGGVFGVAGTIMHSAAVVQTGMAGIVIPVGLILSGVGCLALLVAVRCLADERGSALAAGLGMLAMLLLFSGEGPGGSVVVPQVPEGEPPLGIIWSWIVAVVVTLVVAWPDLHAARPAAGRAPAADA